VAWLRSLLLVYSLLEEHQKQDPFCVDLRDKIQARQGGVDNFQMSRGLLCYYPKGLRRCRCIVPVSLRPMLLRYLNDSVLSGHLGAFSTFQEIARKSYWSKMRAEIIDYVHRCDLLSEGETRVAYVCGWSSIRTYGEVVHRFYGPA